MKKLLIFTLIVSSLTLIGLWSGRKLCAMMPIFSSHSGEKLYAGLGLNASQSESIKNLEGSFQKEADEICMKVCEERVNLLKEIKKGQIGNAEIEKKVEAIGQSQVLLEKKTAAHILAVNKILTPAQSAVYLERIYRQQCRMAAKSGYGSLDVKMES